MCNREGGRERERVRELERKRYQRGSSLAIPHLLLQLLYAFHDLVRHGRRHRSPAVRPVVPRPLAVARRGGGRKLVSGGDDHVGQESREVGEDLGGGGEGGGASD